ncbi:LysR family transcriptional regulator [Paenibacillus hamazuiensis]|uniref:LysR family transcriptional regulator n=1 Tax=Paenibacillus hamazuiensis TaxID=2936508 RepID=UPI0020105790|nr:LysR family transcriptional regulator [Paenibacillus hamazuiensis]
MRIEQLQYFVEVARHQSFSLAAGHLHISQPSISQGISDLEKELNVKLFERSRSGVQLTKTGQTLLKKAQSALNLVQDIYDEARAESQSLTGNLQIAAIPSMCNAFLSDVLSIYKKKHPHVRLEVSEDGTKQIMQDVIAGRADLGFISSQPGDLIDNRIEFHRMLTGTYVACIGKHSPVPLYNPMPAEVIADEPIITFKPGYRQEEYLKKLLKTDRLNVLLTIGYTEAAKKLIAEGVAIGFYPDFSIRKDPYVQSGEIIPLDIKDNELMLHFGWIRLKSKHMSKAAGEFIKVLRNVIDGSQM